MGGIFGKQEILLVEDNSLDEELTKRALQILVFYECRVLTQQENEISHSQ